MGGTMKLKSLITSVGLGSVVILSSLSFTGCTPKVTDEQLAMLQELRKKESSLQQQIANTESEISKIQNELNARKSELKDCSDQTEFVKQKLNQWPDVWPDYNPNK